jgi:hypothetical protein
MKVFSDLDCLLHNPPYEILSGDKIPYFESPARLQVIKEELEKHPSLFSFHLASSSSQNLDIARYIGMVHSRGYLGYLANAYENWVRSGGSKVVFALPHLKQPCALLLMTSFRTRCYLKRFHTQSCYLDLVRWKLTHFLPLRKQVRLI